jgi:hypothetical protein
VFTFFWHPLYIQVSAEQRLTDITVLFWSKIRSHVHLYRILYRAASSSFMHSLMAQKHTKMYFLFNSDTFTSEFHYIVCTQNVSPPDANLLIVLVALHIYTHMYRWTYNFICLLGVSQISTANQSNKTNNFTIKKQPSSFIQGISEVKWRKHSLI